jgi:ABC-type molybdate transport system permease subunit
MSANIKLTFKNTAMIKLSFMFSGKILAAVILTLPIYSQYEIETKMNSRIKVSTGEEYNLVAIWCFSQ